MRNVPRIRLFTDGIMAYVFINGEEIKGVRSFTFSAEPNEIPTVMMELDARDTEVEGKIEVILAALNGEEGEREDADVQTPGES